MGDNFQDNRNGLYQGGFIDGLQYMLSSPRLEGSTYVTTEYQTNLKMGSSFTKNSKLYLWYNTGEAIYNNVKHLEEKDTFKNIEKTFVKMAAASYAYYFPAGLSWKFDEKNCKMMQEGQWTELFDLWNDRNWKTYSQPRKN